MESRDAAEKRQRGVARVERLERVATEVTEEERRARRDEPCRGLVVFARSVEMAELGS